MERRRCPQERPLARGVGRRRRARFFHLDDDGNEQNDVYAIDRDGSVEAVVEMDGQVVLQDVGEDGETLLVGSTREGR